jgi:hypothetical protein
VKLISFLGFSLVVNMVALLTPTSATAGYRNCKGYPNYVTVCDDETGFRYVCTTNIDGAYSLCTGKNSYRRECTHSDNVTTCKDSNGVRSVCNHSTSGSTCENSKGFRSVCKYYDGRVTICNDVSRWGKPIKS